jgi:hypothetical protein
LTILGFVVLFNKTPSAMQRDDTQKGNTSGLFGLEDGKGMTGGIFDEAAMLGLQEEFFPKEKQVPWSPDHPDLSIKEVKSGKEQP